jgi:hypothetical protein
VRRLPRRAANSAESELEYANVWESIVGSLSIPGRVPEPEPEIKRWTFCKGKLYENIGTLPDGSLFNPNGYDDALVREVLAAPEPVAKTRGKRGQFKTWSKADIEKLRLLAKTHTQTEAAKVTGRSASSINGAAHQFRITFKKPQKWTPAKLDELRSMARTHMVAEAAVAMGMSFHSIQSACRRHKVSFKKGGEA